MAKKPFSNSHNHLGSYTSAELPNVSGATIQSAAVEVGDIAFNTTLGILLVCTDATPGAALYEAPGAGGGGGGEVLFKWNGADLSQLLDTANLSVTDNSFLPDVPLRTCIKVDVPGAGGTYGLRRFDIDLPRRYRLRFTIGHGNAFNHIDGIAFNVQSTTRYMSFGHYGSTNMSIYGFNDPTPVWPGATPGIVAENGVSEWDLLYDSVDATGAGPPRFRILFHHPLDTHYLDNDWWSQAAAGAGWDTPGQPNGLGIAWLNNGGGHLAYAIYDIVVTTHPADL
jgi:hypothetical protein